MENSTKLKFFDIAANLSDNQFYGIYYGKKVHEDDHDSVIARAKKHGVDKFLFVGGYYEDTVKSLKLCKEFKNSGYSTLGIHPCRADEILKNEEEYYEKMELLYKENKNSIVAIGECGLDYDRLHYSKKETQLKAFPIHFEWAEKFGLPMYLHSRNCADDFLEIVKRNRDRFKDGVVHSFTGTENELKEYLDLGFYIGVNGCSLKTEENIEIAKKIPLEKLMIETDAPYCEVRNSHASMKYLKEKIFKGKVKKKFNKNFLVKGRNEPCKIIEINEIFAKIKEVSEKELADVCYENSCKVFNINK